MVFLSPILTDHRVWGGFPQTVTEQVGSGIGAVVCSWPVQPEEGFDSVAIVEAALEEHGLGQSVSRSRPWWRPGTTRPWRCGSPAAAGPGRWS